MLSNSFTNLPFKSELFLNLNCGEGWTYASKSKIFLLIFVLFVLNRIGLNLYSGKWNQSYLHRQLIFQKEKQVYFWLWCCKHKFCFLQTTGTPPIQFKWCGHTKQKKIQVNLRALIFIWDILAKPHVGPMHRKLFAKIHWRLYRKVKQQLT